MHGHFLVSLQSIIKFVGSSRDTTDAVDLFYWKIMMKPLHLLLCSLLAGASLTGFPAVAQTSIAEQQDARVIENLQRNGADLTKTHDIDFFLVFGQESDAVAAADNLRARGYEIASIGKVPKRTLWEVHAKRKMAPEIGAMQAITRDLSALAASHHGYYDGWGTVGIK